MDNNQLAGYVNAQIKNMLISDVDVTPFIEETYERTLSCFQPNKNKYFQAEIPFSVYHSGQYSIFLYFLAHTIYKTGNQEDVASKVYYLNKILHSVDWFYAIELPVYWGVEHPVGSVLGRATYQSGLFFYQGCTIGGNKKKYPVIGKNVIMYSNSSILGDSIIGDNVILSTGSTIKDENIPDHSLVFGQSPHLVVKQNVHRVNEIVEEIWKTQ